MNVQKAKQLLERYYGYTEFRPGQDRIIRSILSGNDVLGIMPTGGGKSICYQIPALLLPGVSLVVSPLISLMKDQIDSLTQMGISATFINSSITGSEVGRRLRGAALGQYKLIYIAPERLELESFRELLRSLPIAMIAIAEAHCISVGPRLPSELPADRGAHRRASRTAPGHGLYGHGHAGGHDGYSESPGHSPGSGLPDRI